ncbi:MAG: branched-chain amino acid aminotransferase, partial [Thermotogaceae bacterium]|nr:branched-chain amino acid aminotransferase [Thermotogaceae bacterium]
MYVFLNDQWVEENEAKVSVFDKGFMSAESVYETLRTFNGRVLRLEEHY